MKIKFCGMTNLDDCLCAQDLGVDYVGFVFYEKSKRYVEPKIVTSIVKHLHVKTVGVFVDKSVEDIKNIMQECNLDFAQVYEDFEIENRIRVFRIIDKLPESVSDGLILLDSFSALVGGSGKSFNWQLLEGFEAVNRAFIAGGISIENAEHLALYRPYGVDLVSSIEMYPGKKDFNKMKSFVKLARSLE